MRSLFLFLFLLTTGACFPQVGLPRIFSDNMVLQRNSEVRFWGWAAPGEEVNITTSWSEQVYKVKTNAQGNWELILPTSDLQGPQQIQVNGQNEIIIKNVLLGEVWLVSGQSNMEWSAAMGIINSKEAIEGADHPEIRFFSIPHSTAEQPQKDLEGNWVSSTPASMSSFSAVAYFFGKKLHEELDVPIGLINSSWGGTPAEVWIPTEKIEENSTLSKAAALQPESVHWPVSPGSTYNAMIAPLIPFRIAGILWYQGESNTVNADYYDSLFTTLIESWREQWQQELPFYYAQIAPFDYGENFDGVKIRDAQRRVLALPKTGMVMTSDIGNIKDIHPRNKLDVGLRFARLALAEVYGKNIPDAYPPLFERATASSTQVQLYFTHSNGLRMDQENTSSQFELAGPNGQFFPAELKIVGKEIHVNSTQVPVPKYVRYSWGNTSSSNIFNAAGLPASSFMAEVQQK